MDNESERTQSQRSVQSVFARFVVPTTEVEERQPEEEIHKGWLSATSTAVDSDQLESAGEKLEIAPELSAMSDREYFFIPFTDKEWWGKETATEQGNGDDGRVSDERKGGKGADSPTEGKADYNTAVNQMLARVNATNKNVTDVYVMCHGWHRNLYSARAALDNIFYRFLRLAERGRLRKTPQHQTERDEEKVPLFVGVHYFSDPGNDLLVNHNGRACCQSFVDLCFERLAANEETDDSKRRRDYESVYEVFTKWTARGLDLAYFKQNRAEEDNQKVVNILSQYHGLELPRTTRNSILAAWTCFHEAKLLTPTGEQDMLPSRASNPLRFLNYLGRALVTIGILGLLIPRVLALLAEAASWVQEWLLEWLRTEHDLAFTPLGGWVGGSALFLFAFVLVWLYVLAYKMIYKALGYGRPPPEGDLSRNSRRFRFRHGANGWKTAVFIALQAVHAAPVLLFLFASALLSSLMATWCFFATLASGVTLLFFQQWFIASILLFVAVSYRVVINYDYPELAELGGGTKLGGYLKNANFFRWPLLIRFALVGFARLPYRVFSKLVHPEDLGSTIFQKVQNQFAFYDMSKKGVKMGVHVASFLNKIIESEKIKGARIHLLGHSHGSLVVTNAARAFIAEHAGKKGGKAAGKGPNIQTLTTINGAFMSSWFSQLQFKDQWDVKLHEMVQGCIATIYSRYDIANGFFYPLAHFGRSSSGSVGVWLDGTFGETCVGEPLPNIVAIDTPNYADRIRKANGCPRNVQFINIDASRIVSEGGFPDGAHPDIYKDDVVQLLYATTLFGEDKAASCATGGGPAEPTSEGCQVARH